MKNLLAVPVIIVIVLMTSSSALAQPDLTYGTSICNFDDPWLTVGVLVRNIGNVTSIDSRIGIYISKSSSILGNYRIASQPIPPLGPNGLITISFNIDLTGDCNDWYAGFFIDYENTVSESNENNNIRIFESQFVIEEGCMADLDGFVASINDATGPLIDFGTCVVNNGNLEFSEQYNVNVYLSVDVNITFSDYLIQTWSTSFGGLEWEQCNFPGPITIPAHVPPGEYYLGGWADVNNVIEESNETNNGFVYTSEKIIVPAPPVLYPDLIVQSVEIIDGEGPDISYKVTVRNLGSGATTGEFKNRIYLSTDNIITSDDVQINDWNCYDILAAGHSKTSYELTSTVTELPPGEYYLGVIADGKEVITESNEGNNTGCNMDTKISIPDESNASHEKAPFVQSFHLAQNIPNPFNPSTTIQYTVPKPCFVTLSIFDLLGKEITTLVNDKKGPGSYSIEWNGNGHAAGIYLYRLKAENFTETRKLVLQK
ncbi:CARDB domain-containing protein [bacterium]